MAQTVLNARPTPEASTVTVDTDPSRSLWSRIRQAWQILRGHNDFADLFELGMDVGADIGLSLAFREFQRTGTVTNPLAKAEQPTLKLIPGGAR